MSFLKLNRTINKVNKNLLKDIASCSKAELSILDNNINLNINGIPSNVIINYSGTGVFKSKMPLDIKTLIGKKTIVITNLFKKEFPEIILEYSGDIIMYTCEITNFDGSKLRATIKNTQKEQNLNQSQTNLEDDTLILYDEPKSIVRRPIKTGLLKPKIDKSLVNKFSKIKKYGKTEAETIARTIINTAPRINYEGKEE